eukprot:4404024-Pleurochrysis_carterae.AAC.1
MPVALVFTRDKGVGNGREKWGHGLGWEMALVTGGNEYGKRMASESGFCLYRNGSTRVGRNGVLG